jgi:hypothetical protein
MAAGIERNPAGENPECGESKCDCKIGDGIKWCEAVRLLFRVILVGLPLQPLRQLHHLMIDHLLITDPA